MLKRQVPDLSLLPAKSRLVAIGSLNRSKSFFHYALRLAWHGLSVFLVFSLFASAAAIADGAQIFSRECAQCHSMDDGAVDIGPILRDIVGSPAAGSSDSYEFSDALKRFADEGGVWDVDTLDKFLQSPVDVIPGTRMNYPGLDDATQRSSLINWLSDPASVELADSSSVVDGALQARIEEVLALTATADPDYGEYLAGECLTCHTDSGSSAVPVISGLSAPLFVKALLQYKDGIRDNQVMKLMVENLGDEELSALAAFFSTK